VSKRDQGPRRGGRRPTAVGPWFAMRPPSQAWSGPVRPHSTKTRCTLAARLTIHLPTGGRGVEFLLQMRDHVGMRPAVHEQLHDGEELLLAQAKAIDLYARHALWIGQPAMGQGLGGRLVVVFRLNRLSQDVQGEGTRGRGPGSRGLDRHIQSVDAHSFLPRPCSCRLILVDDPRCPHVRVLPHSLEPQTARIAGEQQDGHVGRRGPLIDSLGNRQGLGLRGLQDASCRRRIQCERLGGEG